MKITISFPLPSNIKAYYNTAFELILLTSMKLWTAFSTEQLHLSDTFTGGRAKEKIFSSSININTSSNITPFVGRKINPVLKYSIAISNVFRCTNQVVAVRQVQLKRYRKGPLKAQWIMHVCVNFHLDSR